VAYDIRPRETARVARLTDAERDQLGDHLRALEPLLAGAADGAAPSAPVSAALADYRAAHERVAREALDRIGSALVHGELAVAAYVSGDIEMAGQYGRASVDFTHPVVPPPPPAAGVLPPEHVSGG
jgi:hypothetical protein